MSTVYTVHVVVDDTVFVSVEPAVPSGRPYIHFLGLFLCAGWTNTTTQPRHDGLTIRVGYGDPKNVCL